MMYGAIESVGAYSKFSHFKRHLHIIHITQCQGINIHYYYQKLYTKKWDEWITMSDHIGSFLYLCHRITESGQKLDDIHIVHTILLSLPCSAIWNVVQKNLLDHGGNLTLDITTAELMSAHDHIKRDCHIEETEKK